MKGREKVVLDMKASQRGWVETLDAPPDLHGPVGLVLLEDDVAVDCGSLQDDGSLLDIVNEKERKCMDFAYLGVARALCVV